MRIMHPKEQILAKFLAEDEPFGRYFLLSRNYSALGPNRQDIAMQMSHDLLRRSIDLCTAVS
jgi:hypothetical protein